MHFWGLSNITPEGAVLQNQSSLCFLSALYFSVPNLPQERCQPMVMENSWKGTDGQKSSDMFTSKQNCM